jgi:hypothetical protein
MSGIIHVCVCMYVSIYPYLAIYPSISSCACMCVPVSLYFYTQKHICVHTFFNTHTHTPPLPVPPQAIVCGTCDKAHGCSECNTHAPVCRGGQQPPHQGKGTLNYSQRLWCGTFSVVWRFSTPSRSQLAHSNTNFEPTCRVTLLLGIVECVVPIICWLTHTCTDS